MCTLQCTSRLSHCQNRFSHQSEMKRKVALWKWLLLFVAAMVLSIIGYGLLMALAELGGIALMNVIGAIVLLLLYALAVRLLERHWPADLPMRRLPAHLFLGLLTGALFMTAVVALIWAVGCCSIERAVTSWQEQLAAVSLFLCVAVGEEIMFRGVLFRWIDERWNTTAALVVSALLFGLMHIFNTGATWWSSLAIAVEAGLLLAVAYKWSGTLWLPIGIHWAWNYVQGHVFGLAVSGESVEDTWLSTFVSGPDLLTGGDFGAEASVFSVVLGLALSILIIWRMKHNTIFDNR